MEKQTDLTTDSGKQHDFHPNRVGRVITLAMEEILGNTEVIALLKLVDHPVSIKNNSPYDQDLEFPFVHFSRLLVGLEKAYGARAGHGLAQRIGRACFILGLHEFGPELGLNDLAFRLLPLQMKLKTGSETFAAYFTILTGNRVSLDMDERYILWKMEQCPMCRERQAGAPCCYWMVGLLQEALFWVSAGKYFEVEERECMACGDDLCTFRIGRIPTG
jgi:predicted hydrocarbon binding protein